jgi:hypothetical protein
MGRAQPEIACHEADALVVSTGMTSPTTIYMPLLNEGTDCWVPVLAERISESRYQVHGPVPEDQSWSFPAGATVRITQHRFQDGQVGLVAVEQASA